MAQRRLSGVAPRDAAVQYALARRAGRALSGNRNAAERARRRRRRGVARQRHPSHRSGKVAARRARHRRTLLRRRRRNRARRRSRCVSRQRHVARAALARLHRLAAQKRARRRRTARSALHQHLRDESAERVAAVGVGQLVSERIGSHHRARSRRPRLCDRAAPDARCSAGDAVGVSSRMAARGRRGGPPAQRRG